MKSRCLFCYKELGEGEIDFHRTCSKKIFGTPSVPELPYTRENLSDLARQVIHSQTTLTGVQAKLSLDINKGGKKEAERFTIVGLWGRYILKPQTDRFAHLPELEDLTMHLAELAKMQVVPHCLVRFADGELCYITRRIDRTDKGDKLPMEDMCQLTERLTEHKYKGSYEQIAKAIQRYSSVPKLDMTNYWEQVIFSWITGNSDMHCKNFSLLEYEGIGYQLSPAYDLLSVKLVFEADRDELAMPLIGAGVFDTPIVNFSRDSFVEAMSMSGISDTVINKIISKMISHKEKWFELIDISFLNDEFKEKYKALITDRISKL